MAEINQIQLPNETIYDIEDATAREAIDSAVTMTFATVATTGSYDDLGNKPTIPTVTLNGTSTTSPSFYAPTGAGTSGQVLTSNGSGAPTWGSAPASGPWEDGSGAYSAQIPDGGADASGDYSVAEGSAVASGDYSHAEGADPHDSPDFQSQESAPEAAGYASHAEGLGTYASGTGSHAEGGDAQASGIVCHAEGAWTSASGYGSHAEGGGTTAAGNYSHTEGNSTYAQNEAEHASGKYNSSTKTNTTFGNAGNTHFSIGIGTGNNAKSNAVEVMQNGDMYVKGVGSYTGAYASSGIKSLQTVLSEKQATLVSGTNIKTINNESILGSGNITISGGVTDVRLSDGTSVVSSGIANLPIPSVSSTDNGKVFGVDSGVWSLITPSTGVTDVTVGGTSVVSSGVAAIPAIPTVPTISTNVVSDKASDTKTSSPKSVYSEIHPTKGTSQPSGGMLPNVWYDLGTLSSNTTFSVASPSDSDITNHYYWTFDTGSSAPTITWPNAITSWYGGTAPTINASTHYEVSLLDGVAICMEV